jgi:type II secretory pathway pseudopilin PulG
MPKIFLYFGKLQIASKLLSLSVFIILLMKLNPTVLAQPSTAPMPTPSQPAKQTNPIVQKLLGQWQTQKSPSLQTLTFIFTSEGKLFIILPNSNTPVAAEVKYSVNSTPQPMHLDVTIPISQEPVLTIFEFTADGQLRLQLDETNPGKPRPTAFSPKASLFKKISNATTLPDNIQLIDPKKGNQATNQPEGEGKQFIGTINRAQQAYYLEYQKFSTTIEQLDINIKPETENYRYRIISPLKQTQSVISTASAKKPELRSYTGITFVSNIKGETITSTAICETDKPSNQPPLSPIVSSNNSQQVKCPAGSHLLVR